MSTPFDGKLYKHPAISIPLGVFKSVDVEILRARPDLGIEKGDIMQIDMTPNGAIGLGFYKDGTGTQYATVAHGSGKTGDTQEGVDFKILTSTKGNSNGARTKND